MEEQVRKLSLVIRGKSNEVYIYHKYKHSQIRIHRKYTRSSSIQLFLPPASEVCEGYVFTDVCLSTRGGGVSACRSGGPQPPGQTPPGRNPPGQTPPADTSPGRPPTRPAHAGIHPLPSACKDTHTPCPVHAGIHPLPLTDTTGRGQQSHWNAFLSTDINLW